MVDEDSQLIQQSKSNDHYTPQHYVDAAREVMGGIDLDPASREEANAIVRATQYYDEDDDGIAKPWAGNVWLNPPYGRRSGDFVDKLQIELDRQNVPQAIVLVNAQSLGCPTAAAAPRTTLRLRRARTHRST